MRIFEPKSDQELVEIARRFGRGPIVHVPCDTAAGREVATINLFDRDRPIIVRVRESRSPAHTGTRKET